MIQIASRHQPSSLSWSPGSFVLEWQYPAKHLAYLRTYYLQTCLSHQTPCLDSSLHAQYQRSTEQSRLWTNAHRRYRCFHLYVIATRKTSFKLTNTPLWNLLPTVLKESLRIGERRKRKLFWNLKTQMSFPLFYNFATSLWISPAKYLYLGGETHGMKM